MTGFLLILVALLCTALSAFFLRLAWSALTVSDGDRQIAQMRISKGWRGVMDVLNGNVSARSDAQRDYYAHAGLSTKEVDGYIVWNPRGQFSEESVDGAHRRP